MKKALLLWYQIEDNFGDVLIYRTVRDFLTLSGFETISCEVGSPCIEIFERANQCDLLLFAGGGIVERWVPNVIRHFEEDYHLLRVPYGVVGFGIADFDYSEYQREIGFWVNNALFFYVRDMHSKNLLNQLSGTNKVRQSADNILYNREILKYGGITDKRVGINLRNIPYQDLMPDMDKDAIKEVFTECNGSIVIPDASEVGMNTIPGADNMDTLRCYENMCRDERIEVTINEIRRCEVVIAMRFHVILVSALLGGLPLPIIYSPKVKFLAEQLGIVDLSIQPNEIRKIPEIYKMAQTKKVQYLARIEEKIFKMRKSVNEMYHEIATVIV